MIRRIHRNLKSRGNRGFTLVELIISIAILVLIMLPLMNSFYRSAQLNKKAKDIQEQSNLAASIIEGLRNVNIKDTIVQFTGATADFNIITNQISDGVEALDFSEDTGLYTPISPDDEQTTYYFAINGIKEGGTAYDALIKMNSSTYKTEGSNILNDFQMPEAINLDIMANAVLFSDGRTTGDIAQGLTAVFDSHAYQTFLDLGEAYAHKLFEQSSEYVTYLAEVELWKNTCEENLMKVPSVAPPAPPVEVVFNPSDYREYCDATYLKPRITKTMKITVNQVQQTIQYGIDYSCIWLDADCGLETELYYPVSTITYLMPVDHVYLYYQPSDFNGNKDIINIINQTPNPDKPINFFLAYQGTDITTPSPQIIYNETADTLSVFSNLRNAKLATLDFADAAINKEKIVVTEQKNRIFETEIKICKYEANAEDKYKKVLYTLSSATENTNVNDN